MSGRKRTKQEAWYSAKLLRLWRESPMYWEALNWAKRGTNQYECEKCGKVFKLREVEVDHIEPRIDPDEGFVDMATLAARTNCPAHMLMVLCEDNCHKKKTQAENKERKRATNSDL